MKAFDMIMEMFSTSFDCQKGGVFYSRNADEMTIRMQFGGEVKRGEILKHSFYMWVYDDNNISTEDFIMRNAPNAVVRDDNADCNVLLYLIED